MDSDAANVDRAPEGSAIVPKIGQGIFLTHALECAP
jgi:hypothetical protein